MKTFALWFLLTVSAFAGTTTLTGTIKDSQGNPLNGTLTMALPVPAQDPSTSSAIAPSPVYFRLVNGAITGGAPLFDVLTINPAGLYYIARAYNSAGTLQFYGNYIVTGGTFNIGTAIPTTVTTSSISYSGVGFTALTNAWAGLNTFSNFNHIIYVDGVTYPYTAAGVQSAINAACTGTLGAVVIPQINIALSGTGLTIPNNCDVGGVGQAATQLSLSSGATTTHFTNASASPTNIRIHDLTLDGGSGTSISEGCVGMNQTNTPTDIIIERVTCQNTGGSAFNVSGATATPGKRIKVIGSKALNTCLNTFSPGTQCYGVLASNNSHFLAYDNEIANGNVSAGITAFSGTNASSATPIIDIQILNNRIHDLSETITTGAGVDVGRARQVVASGNIFYNLAMGGCVFFEAVWGGSIAQNECSVANTVLTGGPFVIKTPDTTQAGEVASQDISVVGNTIVDNSAVATTNNGIAVNGAQRNITIKGNAISYLNQASNSPSGIILQLGTNDANISGASQNFCNGVVVEGNTITNRPGTGSATIIGINLQQVASGCIADQVVISNNVVLSTFNGIKFSSTAASNGITHAYIHDNSVDTPTTGLASDGKTYTSLFAWNNNASGVITNMMPPQSFGRFKLLDQGQCTMAAGACTAQTLASTYANAPNCVLTWTGSGTLAGTLKVSSSTTTVTPSSSTGTDTAVVNWLCFGN